MVVSRRGFIKSATATTLAGTVLTTEVSAKSKSGKGQLVIVYDDGPISDMEKAVPVHKDEDVPASLGIVPSWIGTDGPSTMKKAMNRKQLKKLESNGFEIMSHTSEHTSLVSFPIAKDLSPGDKRLYPKDDHSHPFHEGYEIEIYDGDKSVKRSIATSGRNDDDELYMEFNKKVGKSFSADDARERLSETSMRHALGDSKKRLEAYGFTVDNLLAPYDQFSDYSKKYAKEYYTGVANAVPSDGVNEQGKIDPFGMRRDYFIEGADWERIRGHLDLIAGNNSLGVFGAHTYKDDVTSDKIRRFIKAAKKRDIEIVTLRQALKDAGYPPKSEKKTTTTTTKKTTSKQKTTTTKSSNSKDDSSTSTSSSSGQPGFGALAGAGGLAGLAALHARRNDEE